MEPRPECARQIGQPWQSALHDYWSDASANVFPADGGCLVPADAPDRRRDVAITRQSSWPLRLGAFEGRRDHRESARRDERNPGASRKAISEIEYGRERHDHDTAREPSRGLSR